MSTVTEKPTNAGTCPRHPQSRNVTTITRRQSGDPDYAYEFQLYRCGEFGCGEFISWEYHGPDGRYRNGLGECLDRKVLHDMDAADFDQEWQRRVHWPILFGLGALGLVVLACFIMSSLVATITLTLIWLVVMVATFWSPCRDYRRARQELEDRYGSQL